jgi:gamma-glutamyl:cysteine ligase YbdK (ATP-grasp superfamily)
LGIEVDRTEFTARERALFARKLHDNLAALKALLARPDFGAGPPSIGAEVELYVIDARSRPKHANLEILAHTRDPQFTLELNRFNLEYNLTPVPAAGRPLSRIEAEISSALARANAAAALERARVIPIGILPTLRAGDFGPHAMTPRLRYEALSRALQRMRGEKFAIRIGGAEPVRLEVDDVTLEGATTSLQIHYRLPPPEFARTFNAIQLVTPVVLAASCNSPLLLGRRTWHETRIPLFKLAVDGRDRDTRSLHLPPRVDFGTGWVREGAYELFAAAVHLHEPLLPFSSRENALARLRARRTPALSELRLHQGTLWPWNRPVYDPAGGGHLRIEMRALPAGPSAVDMMANAAFALGLARALRDRIDDWLPGIPFATAASNFYRAAEHGLEATLFWPDSRGTLQRRNAAEIAQELLPLAARGLRALGLQAAESRHYLGIMRTRLARRQNGAVWQLRQLGRLETRYGRTRALARIVDRYAGHSLGNLPVAEWPDIE